MQDVSPGLLIDCIWGYKRTAAIQAAIRLDVFSQIAAGATNAARIASESGAAERGIRILCDYLTVLGLLTKADGRYGLTPSSALFLDRKSPAYMGRVEEFLAAPEMQAFFLADPVAYVRNGGAPGLANIAPENPLWVTFARAMVPFSGPVAAGLAQKLAAAPDRPRRVLDIAAGHGMFGIELLRAIPEAEVVAIDWPAVLEVARENAERFGVSDRLELRHGSAFDVNLGSDNDLVLLANFLHHFDEPTNTAFLKKVRAALRAGGQAIAVEFVPNPDRVSPDLPAFFSFEMLGSTPAGDAYTGSEFERMFKNAGFAEIEISPAPPSPENFVVARA